MKNRKKRLCAWGLLLCFLMMTACGKSFSRVCTEHTGQSVCKTCGMNYYQELTRIIQSKATDDTANTVVANTEEIDCRITYNEEDNCVLVSLVYKNISAVPVVFLMTIKPTTGHVYGWAMSCDGKMAGGTFDAEQVEGIVFEPPIEYNDISKKVFDELNLVYKESISFCADVLYSLTQNSVNNLTIKNLGFTNYMPNA